VTQSFGAKEYSEIARRKNR